MLSRPANSEYEEVAGEEDQRDAIELVLLVLLSAATGEGAITCDGEDFVPNEEDGTALKGCKEKRLVLPLNMLALLLLVVEEGTVANNGATDADAGAGGVTGFSPIIPTTGW